MCESFSRKRRQATAAQQVLWAVLVAISLVAADAGAKRTPDEEFQAHYDQALTLYENRQYEAAAREFQTAYAIKQLPRLILNLGQVYRKMGRAKEALGYYELYLRLEPNPKLELKTELEGYINQLRAMISAAERAKTEVDQAQQTAKTDSPIGTSAAPPASETSPAPAAASSPPSPSSAPPPDPSLAAQRGASAAVATAAPAPPPASTKPEGRGRRLWPIGVGIGAAVLVAGALAIGLGVGLAPRGDTFWTARPLP